jgi:hypothetical protein
LPDSADNDLRRVFGDESSRFRIAYFDASLFSHTGHQANACRHITGELRARAFQVDVFASIQIQKDLAVELEAVPWFRLRPYEQSRAFGRIDSFIQALSFGQDIRLAWLRGRYPFVYFNSVLSPQFAAIGRWLASFPGGETPIVAIEFGAPSGASTDGWFEQFAGQYRIAGRYFRALKPDRALLFTFDPAASSEYSNLLGLPVQTLPPVHTASESLRLRERGADGRLTLGFLGQQRTEKGINLLPDIIQCLRRASCPARILIQDGDPAERPITRTMREIAENDPFVEFFHQSANPLLWKDLLGRTDLMVLPYEPNRYKASYSAVAVEAVSAGIPMVVPGGTTMESLAIEYQGGATTFYAWRADTVCQAILRAMASFENLSERAFVGAGVWEKRNGAKPFADRLLEFSADSVEPFLISKPSDHPVSRVERAFLNSLLGARVCGKRIVHSLLGPDRFSP